MSRPSVKSVRRPDEWSAERVEGGGPFTTRVTWRYMVGALCFAIGGVLQEFERPAVPRQLTVLTPPAGGS